MGDTSKVAAIIVGVVTLHFDGCKVLVLQDCLYIPIVRRNLISILSLACNKISTLFNKNLVFIKWNDDVICCGMLVDNLYMLKPITPIKLIHINLIIRERNLP